MIGAQVRDNLGQGDLILIPTPEWVWDCVHVKNGKMYPAVTDDEKLQLAHILSIPIFNPVPRFNDFRFRVQVIFRTGVWDGRVVYVVPGNIYLDAELINTLTTHYKINRNTWKYKG